MIYSLPRQQGTNMKLVGDPVCPLLRPHTVDFPVKQPIAVGMKSADPKPAAIGALNFAFESLAWVTRCRSAHDSNDTTNYTQFIGEQLLSVLTDTVTT